MLTFIFRHPIVILFALGLIALALGLAWRKHQLLLTGHLCDGKVVELIPHRGNKGGISYSLRVAYTDRDGRAAAFVTSFSSNPPLHAYGEKVRVVVYPAANAPDILAFADLYLFPWTCFCAGLFLLLMCLGFAYGPNVIDAVYLPHFAPLDASRAYLR
jgi:hypothetical protein